MAYRFNADWFKRTQTLTFNDLLKISERFSEFRYYEGELPLHPKILDIGVGLGYETAYYLSKGASVDALDYDKKVLAQLEKRCSRYATSLKTLKYSVPFTAASPLTEKYDLIILSNILHFLEYKQIKKCVEQLIPSLKENGFIVLRAHSKKHTYNTHNHHKKKEYKYFFSLDDLGELFPDRHFQIYYNAEYFRLYNEHECRLFGYEKEERRSKYGISTILKKIK